MPLDPIWSFFDDPKCRRLLKNGLIVIKLKLYEFDDSLAEEFIRSLAETDPRIRRAYKSAVITTQYIILYISTDS